MAPASTCQAVFHHVYTMFFKKQVRESQVIRTNVSVVANLKCERDLLWSVDVLNQQFISVDPASNQIKRRSVAEPIGWVLSIENSDLVLVGLKSGIALLHAFDEEVPLKWIDKKFPGNQTLRLNDAKVDHFGRLWSGSMCTENKLNPSGELAHYSFRQRSWNVIDTGYVIPNGPAFNSDSSLVLHSDSAKRVTYQYHLNPETGAVTDRTVWREFNEEDGLPDGMTFDSEGFVWIAHWGIGEIRRYDPKGTLCFAVAIPASQVTNVCFGGKFLDRIFVTSAKFGLSQLEKNNEPNAGSLFEIHGLGIKGLPNKSVDLQPELS